MWLRRGESDCFVVFRRGLTRKGAGLASIRTQRQRASLGDGAILLSVFAKHEFIMRCLACHPSISRVNFNSGPIRQCDQQNISPTCQCPTSLAYVFRTCCHSPRLPVLRALCAAVFVFCTVSLCSLVQLCHDLVASLHSKRTCQHGSLTEPPANKLRTLLAFQVCGNG